MLLKLGIFCMLFHCVITKSGLLIRDSVLFVERNSVVFSESSWTLMTGIDLYPGIDFVTLDNWLLKQIHDNATGALGSYRELTAKKMSVEARWRRYRLNDIRTRYKNIIDTIPETQREKRGLIDAGGIALKWLFGVSTQEDLEAAHREMAQIGNKQGAIMHALHHQATLIDETLWGQKITAKILSDMNDEQISLKDT